MALPLKGIIFEATTLPTGQGLHHDGKKMPCSDLELNFVECLEAYGAINGKSRCAKFMEDLQECKNGKIRLMRLMIMRQERAKKVVTGEIPWAKRYGTPYAYDSFVVGTFFP